MKIIFSVAIGGATGAILRYFVFELTYKYLYGLFPWGTLIVNLIGSLFIGFIWQMFESVDVTPNLKKLLMIGLLGAFTTFSTFSFDNLILIRNGEMKIAGLNIILSNVGGIAFAFAGFKLAKYFYDISK